MTEAVATTVTETPTTNAQTSTVATTPVVTPAATSPQTEPAAKSEPEVAAYTTTGDHGVDIAGQFFHGLGIGEDSPEVQEALRGNWQYLEAKIASLGDKAAGAERYIELAKQGVARLQANEKSTVEARAKVVIDAVGGEEQWEKMSVWAQKNGSPEELKEFKAAFAMGGIVAQATALFLQSQYLAAGNVTVEPQSPTTVQANVVASTGPMTRQQYTAEVQKLRAEVGDHRMDSDPRYHALRARLANQ